MSNYNIDARLEELNLISEVIAKRMEELEKVKRDIAKVEDPAGLDALPFKISEKYAGSEWLPAKEVPDWAKRLRYPIETGAYKYYLTKSGNLNRYSIRKV